MKNLVLILAAVFCSGLCSQAALAQSDDYDQVAQPIPVPAGELVLDELKEVKLTDKVVLTTYLEQKQLRGKGLVLGLDGNADVNCSLSSSSEVAMSNFKQLQKESVGGSSGARFYISPKESISLKYQTSSVGVEAVKPWCNGEPELCDGQMTYAYRTVITLTDKASNKWALSCLAPFSRELYASDVKIIGLKIK